MKLDLSILEFGNIAPPQTYAHHVMDNLFSLAQQLDQLGFKRFWMSEHYGPEFAWHSPEILLPLLAGYTDRIKIGQAGVLLRYHAPYRVAHNFTILSALYPGRIDLGVVPAMIPKEALEALIGAEQHPGREAYRQSVEQLFKYIGEKNIQSDGLFLPMQGTARPDMWLLGTTGGSVERAVAYRSNFCISLFHIGAQFAQQKDVIKKFKEEFYEKHGEVPPGVASVICLCSDDQQLLEKERRILRESTQAQGYILGSASECEERLLHLADAMGLDEIVINISGSNLAAKSETAALLGEALLKPQVVAA